LLNVDWAKRSHKGLRKWVLHIVKQNPRTGAEIMDIMETASQGWWRPSPGSVYPLLDAMVQEGVLTKLEGKKYTLTEKGDQELNQPFGWFGFSGKQQPRSLEEVLDQMSGYISYLEDLSMAKDPKLQASSDKLRAVKERMAKLGES